MKNKLRLNKTNVKGLYLTNEGKPYHKACKREIKPTATDKVKFNGKLYDLKNIVVLNGSKTAKLKNSNPKPPVKKRFSISELKKQGFSKTSISGLYISKTGIALNYNTNRFLTATAKGNIIINGKGYNFVKLILETFGKIPIRSGQVIFKNGNNRCFHFENLEYKSTIKQTAPNEIDLIQCIRFYFEVDKKLNRNSLMIKYYLNEVVKYRAFNLKYKGLDFELFLEYLKNDFRVLSNNQKKVFNKFNYTATNGKNAINKYLNLLICDCLQDFENGLLKVKGFKPNPLTKTQKLKELQKMINKSGLNVKIPLRKPSVKEILNKFKKQITDLKRLF